MKHDNVNRYTEFCQLRREVRGSTEYVIVGIDVAKDRHHAFFGTATGETLLKDCSLTIAPAVSVRCWSASVS